MWVVARVRSAAILGTCPLKPHTPRTARRPRPSEPSPSRPRASEVAVRVAAARIRRRHPRRKGRRPARGRCRRGECGPGTHPPPRTQGPARERVRVVARAVQAAESGAAVVGRAASTVGGSMPAVVRDPVESRRAAWAARRAGGASPGRGRRRRRDRAGGGIHDRLDRRTARRQSDRRALEPRQNHRRISTSPTWSCRRAVV